MNQSCNSKMVLDCLLGLLLQLCSLHGLCRNLRLSLGTYDCLCLQVGFCTLYTFYAYPDTKRFRLSQILVLPPFQHKGIGAALLQAAYVMADKCNAVDVTVSLTMFSLF